MFPSLACCLFFALHAVVSLFLDDALLQNALASALASASAHGGVTLYSKAHALLFHLVSLHLVSTADRQEISYERVPTPWAWTAAVLHALRQAASLCHMGLRSPVIRTTHATETASPQHSSSCTSPVHPQLHLHITMPLAPWTSADSLAARILERQPPDIASLLCIIFARR